MTEANQTVESSRAKGSGAVRASNIIDAKHEPHRIYTVIDADEGAIERTARDVSDGSKLLSNVILWRANFDASVARVRAWCRDRSDLLRAALVDIRSNKVLLYFVPASDRYDLDLGRDMTTLEVELGSAGIGYVESLQVPARSLERFAAARSLVVWVRAGDKLLDREESQVTH